jgi:hypothetical protein
MTNLKDLISNEKTKGVIAIIAAIIMHFTPDHIDVIIEAGLAAFGISRLVIKKEDWIHRVFINYSSKRSPARDRLPFR